MQKTCNEMVYDSDDPPPAQPKPKRAKKEKYQPAQVHLKVRGQEGKLPASTSTPKSKRTKKKEVITVGASPSTPLKLQHAPTAPSSPFDLNYSPVALTRR